MTHILLETSSEYSALSVRLLVRRHDSRVCQLLEKAETCVASAWTKSAAAIANPTSHFVGAQGQHSTKGLTCNSQWSRGLAGQNKVLGQSWLIRSWKQPSTACREDNTVVELCNTPASCEDVLRHFTFQCLMLSCPYFQLAKQQPSG